MGDALCLFHSRFLVVAVDNIRWRSRSTSDRDSEIRRSAHNFSCYDCTQGLGQFVDLWHERFRLVVRIRHQNCLVPKFGTLFVVLLHK